MMIQLSNIMYRYISVIDILSIDESNNWWHDQSTQKYNFCNTMLKHGNITVYQVHHTIQLAWLHAAFFNSGIHLVWC